MSDKLARAIKPIGSNSLSARLAAKPKEEVDVSKFSNRIALIFDDSGSMGYGAGSTLEDAKKGVEAFLQTINPQNTAVAIYPLCADKQPLVNNIPLLFSYTMGIKSTGGTAIFKRLDDILQDGTCNRVLLFSDGGPTDRYGYDENQPWSEWESTNNDKTFPYAAKLKEKGIPVDTVYIGGENPEATKFMQLLAELTGGIYLHFTDSTVFGKNMKYLAPKYRAMLTDGSTRSKIEKGEI